MAFRIGTDTGWKSPTDVRVAVGGQWKRVLYIRTAVGGFWKDTWAYDVVGPGPVTGFTATWNNTTSNKCVVTYTTPSDTDFHHVTLYVNRSGSSSGPWTSLGDFTDNKSTARTVNDTTVTMSSNTTYAPSGFNTSSSIHYYKAVPYDTLGNAGTAVVVGSTGASSSVVRGMLSSPFYVQGTNSRTWSGSAWATSGNAIDSTGVPERVGQGYTANGQDYGFYWYDTKRTGISPSALACWTARTDAGFNTTAPEFYLSQAPSSLVGAGSSPTGYAKSSVTVGTSLNNSTTSPYTTSAWHTLPTSWWTNLMDGSTWKSILCYTGETSVYGGSTSSLKYLVMYSVNEGGYGVSGGMLRVTHSG